MGADLWALTSLAFGLGILHALDADHVVAVCGLSSHRPEKLTSILFCTRWAFGHSAALLLIGSAVLFLGMAIPESLSMYAEYAVGAVLVLIGLYVLVDVYRQRAHLHFHQHDGSSQHAHWHTHHDAGVNRHTQNHANEQHEHNHAPVLIGVLHGVAGSAPLLALLPLSQMSSPWSGLLYLMLFGFGVLLAMLLFGGLLGQVFGVLKSWGNRFINALRISVSLVSIAYGMKLLMVNVL